MANYNDGSNYHGIPAHGITIPPVSQGTKVDPWASQAAKTPALDLQVGGNHYKGMKIQPIEFIHANGIGYGEGAVIKYICRYKQKGGLEDLKKARHFIDLLIELEQRANKESPPAKIGQWADVPF